jgi:hypothetical protein
MVLRIKRESTETNEGKLCQFHCFRRDSRHQGHVVGGAVHWLPKALPQYLCALAIFSVSRVLFICSQYHRYTDLDAEIFSIHRGLQPLCLEPINYCGELKSPV